MTILRHSLSADKLIDQETGEVLTGAAGAFSAPARGSASRLPLVGNTGVHRSAGSLVGAAVSIDALTVVPHCGFDQVAGLLAAFGWDSFEQREGGSRWCQEVYVFAHGLRVEALPRDRRQNYCIVSMMGEGCGWLGSDGCRALLAAFADLARSGCRVNFTRIDVAVDTQAFPASWFERALLSGAVSRRSDSYDVHRSEGGGLTVYLGAPTSDKRWRVYHKLDGSTFGEGVPFTRVEQQFRNEPAAVVAGMFLAAELDQWGALAAGLLDDYAQVSKRWWRAFLGVCARAAVVCKRVRSTVEKQRAWLERQVAPALALVVDAITNAAPGGGRVFLEKLLLNGRRRRSPVAAVLVRENVAALLPVLAVFDLGALS